MESLPDHQQNSPATENRVTEPKQVTSFSGSEPLSTPSDLQETIILKKNEENLPTLAKTLEHLDELLSENAKGEEGIQMREKPIPCTPEQTKNEDLTANSTLLGYQTSPLANRSHLSTIFSESELEHELEKEDDIGELSEIKSIVEPLDFKKASFSSIASSQGRADFVSALDTINQALAQARSDRQKTPISSNQPQQGVPSFKSTHIVLLTDSKAQQKMDSPPNDFSPNASPRHGQMPIPDFSPRDHSNPESIDSTGFEKVERPSDDVLEQYSQNFASQMQQSIFGQLPDDPDFDGFELIENPKNEMKMGAQTSRNDAETSAAPTRDNENDVQLLERISGDIDAPNDAKAQSMQSPRDEILEKSYGDNEHEDHGNNDLIDIPRNEQNHDFLDNYQDHPPQPAPRHPTPPRDDFADLLVPVAHIDQPQQNQQSSPPAVPTHDDPFHLDYPTDTQPHDEDLIREHVEDVHDDVDAMMARMAQNVQEEPEAHPASPSGDSGRDTLGKLLNEHNGPQFGRQTPEELMIDREGPLTIPELPETLPQQDEEDELDAFVRPPSIGHHGFETEPRPPTPPKDISDEDVKPSAIQIPGAHHHHHAHKQHSILKHASSGPWVDFKTIDPRVLDLIYWRDPKKSGIALALTLIGLFVLAKYPILSVVTYTSLLVLAGTLGFRIFKAVEAQIKKTEQQNPFQPLLDTELSLPQDKVHEQVDVLVEHGQLLANQTRRLFLVESIVDSVKFGLLLWALTYISAWFSGFGLLILFVLGVFSVPKFYEVYQEPIDQHLSVIKGHIDNVTNIVEEKLPFLKRARVETEKKEQ